MLMALGLDVGKFAPEFARTGFVCNDFTCNENTIKGWYMGTSVITS